MTYEIVREFPHEIIFQAGAPCISLYQTTHRYSPENNQDPIVFKNLVTEIENLLKQKYSKSEVQTLLLPFYRIRDDRAFWEKTQHGLAVLANQQKCVVYDLPLQVANLAIVADSFHIKPLIRSFQKTEKYHLLGLNGNEFSLFEGTQFAINEVTLESGIARTIKDALGEEFTEPSLNFGSYGGGGRAIFHGQGGRKDEIDKDLERFFRYVDKTIFEHYSKPFKRHLILFSLAEHHGIFRKISNNHYLLEEGIKASFDSANLDQMKETSLEFIESLMEIKNRKLVEEYHQAKDNLLGSDDLAQVARAAFEKRVRVLLAEADRIIPGKLDESTGKLELMDLSDPDSGDILNTLSKSVLESRGEIIVLSREMMPSTTGVAAIYRF